MDREYLYVERKPVRSQAVLGKALSAEVLGKRVGKRLWSKVRLRESWDKAMQGGTRLSREQIEYLTQHEDWS